MKQLSINLIFHVNSFFKIINNIYKYRITEYSLAIYNLVFS